MSQTLHSASPVNDGEVYCPLHPEKAIPLKRSGPSAKNPNRCPRDFFSCRVGNGNTGCSFFKWADELPNGSPVSSRIQSQSFLTPPSTPSKRSASDRDRDSPSSSHSKSYTPSSPAAMRRLEVIHAYKNSPRASESTEYPRSQPSLSSPPQDIPPHLPSWSEVTPPASSERRGTKQRIEPLRLPQSPTSSVRFSSSASSSGRSVNTVQKGFQFDNSPFLVPSGIAQADGEDEDIIAAEIVDTSQRVAAHIQNLQRRLSAAEQSNNAKALRLAELDQECKERVLRCFSLVARYLTFFARLRARNEDLERLVQSLT
ncbi:unnamed protein product [Mycena citricolor]|uniref:GRF-type domain-containing protein n=1 Tax=Mycena citricolor TaxID=2018698 RepID=A0AAD2HWT4_9AGAR|nr:unnamed protein product [Mycena citricolor]